MNVSAASDFVPNTHGWNGRFEAQTMVGWAKRQNRSPKDVLNAKGLAVLLPEALLSSCMFLRTKTIVMASYASAAWCELYWEEVSGGLLMSVLLTWIPVVCWCRSSQGFKWFKCWGCRRVCRWGFGLFQGLELLIGNLEKQMDEKASIIFLEASLLLAKRLEKLIFAKSLYLDLNFGQVYWLWRYNWPNNFSPFHLLLWFITLVESGNGQFPEFQNLWEFLGRWVLAFHSKERKVVVS